MMSGSVSSVVDAGEQAAKIIEPTANVTATTTTAAATAAPTTRSVEGTSR